jgi:hypothetical protein
MTSGTQSEIADFEREILIAYYIRLATDCVKVAPLARGYIDRAQTLIKSRSQEQIKRMEKERGLA